MDREDHKLERASSENLALLFVRVSAQEQMQIASELGGFGFSLTCYRIDSFGDAIDVIQKYACDAAFVNPSGLDFPAYEAVEMLSSYLPVIVLGHELPAREAVALMRAGAKDVVFSDELARVGPAVSMALRGEPFAAAYAEEDVIDDIDSLLDGLPDGPFGEED